MVRYLVSLNWDGFIGSTILTAFEAYGSALVGITPFEHSAGRSPCNSGGDLQSADRG